MDEPAPERPAEKPKDRLGAKGLGGLITSSEPVARVAIDGKDTGRWTPISTSRPLEIPPGEHLVTYTDSDGRKANRNIQVPVGEMVRVPEVKDFR